MGQEGTRAEAQRVAVHAGDAMAAALSASRDSSSPASSGGDSARDPGDGEKLVESAKDASREIAAFSAEEEAFFSRGLEQENAEPVESFDDLDEEYELPKTLWQRLMSNPNRAPGKKK